MSKKKFKNTKPTEMTQEQKAIQNKIDTIQKRVMNMNQFQKDRYVRNTMAKLENTKPIVDAANGAMWGTSK